MIHARRTLVVFALLGACKGDAPREAQGEQVSHTAKPVAPAPDPETSEKPAPAEPPPIDPPRAGADAAVKAKRADHLGFAPDKLVGWYALEGRPIVPSWAATTDADGEAVRDDDLRTAWRCTPSGDRPCALGLSFAEPATVRALRLYGAAGPDWNTYRGHPRIETIRVHTDAGWLDVTLDDGASHNYVVLAEPIQTRTLAVEITATYDGRKSQEIHLAELEALGTAGPPRPPLDLDPSASVVSFETEAWKQKSSGHTIRLAFLEVVRPDGTPRRLLRGTALLGRKGDRFLLVEKLHGSSCTEHAGSYILLDQRTRMLYPLGEMGGVPGTVLRHDVGEGFAVRPPEDASRPFRAAVLEGEGIRVKWPPKDVQRAEEARVDWGFTSPIGLPRGGSRLDAPPEGCTRAQSDEFAALFEGGQPSLPAHVVVCDLDSVHRAVLATDESCGKAWMVAVVDGTGAVVHRQDSKEDGRGLRLARIGGAGLLVEATKAAGASSDLLRVAADGITVFEKGAALALRPPATCDTCDDRFAVERQGESGEGEPQDVEPTDAPADPEPDGPTKEAPEVRIKQPASGDGLPSLDEPE